MTYASANRATLCKEWCQRIDGDQELARSAKSEGIVVGSCALAAEMQNKKVIKYIAIPKCSMQ